MERLPEMIRIFSVSAVALWALVLPPGDFTVKPVFAHGLMPADEDVFYRRYRGDDEVGDDDRGGGRGRDKDKGRDQDKGSESSGGGKGGDGGGRSGGKSGGNKSKSSGRSNANDSDDRFGK